MGIFSKKQSAPQKESRNEWGTAYCEQHSTYRFKDQDSGYEYCPQPGHPEDVAAYKRKWGKS